MGQGGAAEVGSVITIASARRCGGDTTCVRQPAAGEGSFMKKTPRRIGDRLSFGMKLLPPKILQNPNKYKIWFTKNSWWERRGTIRCGSLVGVGIFGLRQHRTRVIHVLRNSMKIIKFYKLIRTRYPRTYNKVRRTSFWSNLDYFFH